MEAWMGRFEESKVGDVIIVSKIKENGKKGGGWLEKKKEYDYRT